MADNSNKKHARSESTDNVLKHPSTKRAKEIDKSDNPYEELVAKLDRQQQQQQQQKADPPVRNVLHWFRSKDLRAHDNRGLHAASQKAREGRGRLLTCFLWAPADLQWHGTSPARVDFVLASLRALRDELAAAHIPLAILEAGTRGAGKGDDAVHRFVRDHGVSHVFANFEYEVDELRRDLDLLGRFGDGGGEEGGEVVAFALEHDQTVLHPAALTTAAGGPLKVFTPYHKAWLGAVAADPALLDPAPAPAANDAGIREEAPLAALFGHALPAVPADKRFASAAERERLRALWPAGRDAGLGRLHRFLKEKVQTYAEHRSDPAADNTSRLSPYFAAGVLSVREALDAARRRSNGGSADFSTAGAEAGVAAWVREIVFREFYRHMMIVVPHNSMNLPQNLKFDFVEWETDEAGWAKWCAGTTGVPFVDAGMRQLNAEAYMHNRLRMNVASYLRCNLLLDPRRGERHFAERLVDWDLCNNTQGWEPGYTVFNPVAQAERCDPRGAYVRRWVPELRGVPGKAVFDPFHRLSPAEFAKLGYPAPHVDFKESKDRCIRRYKRDMADADP
ncbi:DNA photolyase, FAD-binding/Cryptochrome [Xylariomycetidae sp. FL0641]|nr:DNA photolyase, FAD-binding/Cryptochrome [Xylariomycetidae sp. FL0641]